MLIREDPLFSLIPLFALVNLGALIFLLFLCRHFIMAFLREIDRTTYFFLLGIFSAALVIRLVVPPIQHIMYIDEAWYMEAAKNFVQHGHPGEYPKPIGWPLILSFFFRIFGISNWVALYTMIVFGALTAFSVFFLAFAILRDSRTALFAALMISLSPVHIRWSATAETNIIALFMACLSLSVSFLYYRNKSQFLLWLSMAAIAFTAQFRFENYLFFPLFLFPILHHRKRDNNV